MVLIRDETNDVAALRAANVGFSMGVRGTDAANDASDVILMNEDLVPIYRTIIWSRHVGSVIIKHFHSYLVFNITGIILAAFISLVNPTMSSIFPSLLLVTMKFTAHAIVLSTLVLIHYSPPKISYPKN